MVRLGDIVPVELLSKESLDQPSPIEPYNWEEYSLHQRDIREGVVDREPPMEEMADEVKLSELLHLVYDILYLFVRNLNYNFLVGDPILSMSIAFPILIFLVGRFNFAAVSLIFAFVVNFNPLYVIPGYMIYRLYLLRFSNPKFKAVKLDHQLGSFKAQKWNEGSCVDDQYDNILLGNDFSTYLTAALLSRIGRRCCILEPVGLPPQILCSGKEEISLNSLTFFRPDRVKKIFQSLALPPLLSPIGTAMDGFCHTILSFHVDGAPTHLPLRSGLKSLRTDLSAHPSCSPDSLQAFDKLQEWCQATTSTIIFYVCSTVTSSINWTSYLGRDGGKWLTLVTGTTCTDLMHQVVEDSYVSLALRMMSYWVSEEYSMKFDRVASSNLMNSLIQSADGAYTVPGGFPTIKSLLIKLITATGGQVLTDVPVSEIALNDKNNEVLGVYVQDPNSQTKPIRVMCRRGLISGTGVLHTLTNFIPLSVTSMPLTSARNKLKKVEEKRPKMFVIFWISGDVLSSELSPCEYIQYLADETNQSERSKGLRSIKIWSPSARDSTRNSTFQIFVAEMEPGDDLVRMKSHPSLGYSYYEPTNQSSSSHNSPAVLSLSASEISSFVSSCTTLLTRLYPSIKISHIQKTEFIPPHLGGHSLSSTVDKFLSLTTAKSDIPGLYFCGKDISFTGCRGDIMSALAAVSAVLGYSPAELQAGRNIITDIQRTAGKGQPHLPLPP